MEVCSIEAPPSAPKPASRRYPVVVRNVFVATAFLMPLVSSANQLRVMPLEEKVATSDIVVIGTVAALDSGDDKPRYTPQYAVVTVTQVLKGTAPQPIRVQYRGPVAEQDPACCAVGKQYLFFLRKMPDSSYVSTNHRLGIVDLTPAAVEPHH